MIESGFETRCFTRRVRYNAKHSLCITYFHDQGALWIVDFLVQLVNADKTCKIM
jgi:hypothetical protein